MGKEQREWCLFAVMAALIVAVVLLAWIDVPTFAPPSVTYQSGQSTSTTTLATVEDAASEQVVRLNSATAEELMQLKGVGETIAERILEYRDANGPFSSVDELLNVEGIGEKRLEQWRPYLTL